MRNRVFDINYDKPLLSQVETIFFSINRIRSISVNEKFFNTILKTDSLRQHYEAIHDKFMNVPISVSDQTNDIIINK